MSSTLPDPSTPEEWKQLARKTQRMWSMALLICIPILLVLNLVSWTWWGPGAEKAAFRRGLEFEAPPDPSFNGPSDKLSRTAFVPTLDSLLPAGKSALWCATLAMAWQEFEKKVGPAIVNGAEDISRSLSKSPDPKLALASYYVAAGWIDGGIEARIQREMKARFPSVPVPEFSVGSGVRAVAYAYLEANIAYEYWFKHSKTPLTFHDAAGGQTPVHAFGIGEEDKDKGAETFRKQVQVLFRKGASFAVDLSRNTRPYQIILARMERLPTLQATFDELERLTKTGLAREFTDAAILLVPTMNWKIEHRYTELEGKPIDPPREGWFSRVEQFIHFKIDRKGTFMSSGVRGDWQNGHEPDVNPNHYIFDRPYLIVLRTRDEAQPFFMMWVDNAEMMQKE